MLFAKPLGAFIETIGWQRLRPSASMGYDPWKASVSRMALRATTKMGEAVRRFVASDSLLRRKQLVRHRFCGLLHFASAV